MMKWVVIVIMPLLGVVVITYTTVKLIETSNREKELQKRILNLQADFCSRLANIKTKSSHRRVLRGAGENGNAWDYYNKAINKLGNLSKTNIMPNTIDSQSYTLILADENKEAIELIRRGTQQLMLEFDFDYSKLLEHWKIPNLIATRNIVKLMSAKAESLIKERKQDEGLKLYADAMRFAQDNAYGYTLIAGMICLESMGNVRENIVKAINDNNISSFNLTKFA